MASAVQQPGSSPAAVVSGYSHFVHVDGRQGLATGEEDDGEDSDEEEGKDGTDHRSCHHNRGGPLFFCGIYDGVKRVSDLRDEGGCNTAQLAGYSHKFITITHRFYLIFLKFENRHRFIV